MEAVICAERGALLLRVRDELRTTVDSLQVAYQSSLAYGVRHSIECEQARLNLSEQIEDLDKTNEGLEMEVERLKGQLADQVAQRNLEREEVTLARKEETEALHAEEAQYLGDLNEQLMVLGLKERPPPPKEEGEKDGKKEGGDKKKKK